MSIGLFIGTNSDTRALANVARDLQEKWPGSKLVTTVGGLKGCTAVLNQVIEKVGRIESQRRYVGFGKQVCLFSANVEEYGDLIARQNLMWLEKVDFVVHSPYHLKNVRALLDAFTPGFRRRLERRLHYIPGGIHPDFVDVGASDKTKWVVPYNRCNEAQKRMSLHVRVTRDALILLRGEPITVDYYVRHMEELEGRDLDLSLYRVQVCPPTRAEWVANAQTHGMFLSTSEMESFGLMYLELIACGAVGVFLDRDWVRRLLPGYPFIASVEHLPAMMAAVYREYPKAKEALKTWQDYIRTTYNHQSFADGLYALLTSVKS